MGKRLNIDLSDNAYLELETLRKDLNAYNLTDTIRYSVAFMKFMLKSKKEGAEIVIRDKKNGTEKIVASFK